MIHSTDAIKEVEVEFVIIRADGSKEDLGKHYHSSSRIKRLLYRVRGWKD